MDKELNLKFESFEGPIELLYHLIKKNEIDIYDIPIATLTDQYLEYIENFPKNMEIMSSFILMAATLLEIKSKMLLPSNKPESLESEEDPREELVKKLIEYKKFKEVSEYFRARSESFNNAIFKEPEKEVLSLFKGYKIDVSEVLYGVTVEGLFDLFRDIITRKDEKIDKIRSSFNSVQKDTFTIDEKIESIKLCLKMEKSLSFRGLFSQKCTKIEVVVTFLALLELIKTKTVTISQQDTFSDITIAFY
ncbi:MAG: segregation/condensation protein A [Defluviitaleaceae bacterium]|nr:segregation/condensation protein A [Defluviitaleaceae bacterium]